MQIGKVCLRYPDKWSLFDLWGFKTDTTSCAHTGRTSQHWSQSLERKIREMDEENLRVRKTRLFLQLRFFPYGRRLYIGTVKRNCVETKGYVTYMVQTLGGDMRSGPQARMAQIGRVAIQSANFFAGRVLKSLFQAMTVSTKMRELGPHPARITAILMTML